MVRLARNLLVTCALLGGLLFAAGFVMFVGALERAESHEGAPADGIVALTGGPERIGDAMELLARGRGGRLLITGVNEKTSKEEIARQRPDLRLFFSCCVDLDYRALNTIGNAEQTRNWVRKHRFRSLIVVTSSYHMPRTLAEISHALPDVRIVAHPVVSDRTDLDAWWRDPPLIKLLAIEYVKYVMSRARIALGDRQTGTEMARAAMLPAAR